MDQVLFHLQAFRGPAHYKVLDPWYITFDKAFMEYINRKYFAGIKNYFFVKFCFSYHIEVSLKKKPESKFFLY